MLQTVPQLSRITFDEHAGVSPVTVLPGTPLTEVRDVLHERFLVVGVVDSGHEFDIAVDLAAGAVVVSADGDVIECGQIVSETPTELDLRQRLRAELRRIADDIVTHRLPVGSYPFLRLGVVDSRADLDRWADYLNTPVDAPDGTGIPSVTAEILLTDRRHGPDLTIGVQSPKETSELESQITAGGTR